MGWKLEVEEGYIFLRKFDTYLLQKMANKRVEITVKLFFQFIFRISRKCWTFFKKLFLFTDKG